jgi:hypothetical protein
MKATRPFWLALLVVCCNAFVFAHSAHAQSCLGGQVYLPGNIPSLVQCIQNDNPILNPQNNSTSSEATYLYVLTNNSANIITHFTVEEGIDMDSYGVGIYRIYGFSYTGTLNSNSIQEGLPFMGISSNDCFSYSSNFITITRNSCEAINCQGGNTFTSLGDTYISVCADGVADVYTFTTTGNGNATYSFILCDDDLNVLDVSTDNTFNFEGLEEGTYYVRGVSHHGALLPATTAPGQPLSGVQSEGSCLALSTYNIQVDVVACTMVEGCTSLYISEYIEGSQNNRAIEIYNPTSFPVNLSNYSVFVYANGSTEGSPVIALSGMLQPGETYVITHYQASTTLLSHADITGSVATFTGNDAVALLYNLEPIDIIGVIGQDPGSEGWTWPNGNETYTTQNRTLVRKPYVNAPTTNWTLSRGQWSVYAENDFSHIGNHIAESCDDNMYVGFENSSILVTEDVGSYDIIVQGYNILAPIDIVVSVIAGNATPNVDYVNSFPITLSFDEENPTQSFTIEIIDDEIMEGFEFFTLQLSDASGTVTFVNPTLTINIEHSDQAYPHRTIAEVTTVNSFGITDSLDVFCTIGGVVHGGNLNPNGVEFTLIENYAGIKVFDPEDNFGYTVTEGDSIVVRGKVAQFHGMTYFYADDIEFISAGHALNSPQVVTILDESHESAMVKIECVELVDPTQWTNLTSGFDVEVTNGFLQFTLHIDRDTDLYGSPAPQGHFSVIGIGSQLDEIAPYHSGYSVWPRYIEDVTDPLMASFTPGSEIVFGEGGSTVSFQNTSNGATQFLWNFGDGETSTEENPVHYYPFSFFMGIADVVITLTVTNEHGCSDTQSRHLDVVYSSVDEITAPVFKVYPNPVKDVLIISGEEFIEEINVTDQVGRKVETVRSTNQLHHQLNTHAWAAGTYYIQVKTNQAVVTYKVIKV